MKMKNKLIDIHNNEKKYNDYDIICNLLKEYHDHDIEYNEIKDRLKDIDIYNLFKILYFTDLDWIYYRKLFDKYQNKYHDPYI